MKRRPLILGLLPAAALAKPPEMGDLLNQFFDQPTQASLDLLRAEWRRLLAAGQAGEQERRWWLRALLIRGHFDEAELVSRELAGWEQRVWPRRQTLDGDAGRRYWEVNTQAWVLEERSLGLAESPQVWVQSAMGCPFSPGAARALAMDGELAPLLRLRSLWFAAGEDLFNSRQWTKEHPDFPLRLVTDERGWFFKRPWSTPTFQFVREGRVIQQFSGWPRDGSHRPELVAGLQAIGLL